MSERNWTVKKIEEITYLYEIAKSLSGTLDLKKSLYSVLEIISKSLGMRRGTITILNPLRDEIQIQVAHGLSKSAMQREAAKGLTRHELMKDPRKATAFIQEHGKEAFSQLPLRDDG